MSDKTESTQAGAEPQGTTIPPVSPQSDGQPTSEGQIAAIVSAILERPELASEIDKRVQSIKDRRFAELEREQKTQKDQLDRFAELLEQGKSVSEAKNQLAIEDDLAYVRELRQKGTSQDESKVTVQNVSGAFDTIATLLGVDLNDPGVQKFQSQNVGDDAVVRFVEYAVNRQKQQPSVSVSGIAPQVGGTLPAGQYDKFTNDQLGDQLAALSSINYMANKPAIDAIKRELERREPTKKILE